MVSIQGLVLWESEGDREIAARIAIAGDFLPPGNLLLPSGLGWQEMAGTLEPCFGDISVTFANLECVLDAEGLTPRPLVGLGEIVSSRSSALDYLKGIHACAVGIANNHSYDFRDAGVTRTRVAITRRGMIPLGAGKSLSGPPEVFVWQGPGKIRVGFWAAARATHDPAKEKSEGVEPATLVRAEQALESFKRQGATFSIALIHAGTIRSNRMDPEDIRILDSLSHSGFNLVAAAHSHRIGGYRRVLSDRMCPSFCFYGLGSVVSGYIASPLEREGLVVVAGLNHEGRLTRLEARPVLLEESGFGTVPSAAEGSAILDRFRRLSEEIADGSHARLFYQDASHGLVRLYLRDAKMAYHHAGLRGLAQKASRLRMRHVRRLVHKVTG